MSDKDTLQEFDEHKARLFRAHEPCPAWEDSQHCWAEYAVHQYQPALDRRKRCACGAELHRSRNA